jgi:hypothetical protein
MSSGAVRLHKILKKMIGGSSQGKRRKLKGGKRNLTLDYRTPQSRTQCSNAWPRIIERPSHKSSTGKISWYADGKTQAKFEAMADGTDLDAK